MARIPYSKRKRNKDLYLKKGKTLKTYMSYSDARKYRSRCRYRYKNNRK